MEVSYVDRFCVIHHYSQSEFDLLRIASNRSIDSKFSKFSTQDSCGMYYTLSESKGEYF